MRPRGGERCECPEKHEISRAGNMGLGLASSKTESEASFRRYERDRPLEAFFEEIFAFGLGLAALWARSSPTLRCDPVIFKTKLQQTAWAKMQGVPPERNVVAKPCGSPP